METDFVCLITVWLPFSSYGTNIIHLLDLLDTFSRYLIAFLRFPALCLLCTWRNVLVLIFRQFHISTMSTLSPSSSNKLFIWLVWLFCFVFGSRKPLLCCMFISLGALLIFEFRISFFSIQKLYFTEYSAWFSLWLLSPNSFLTV